MEIETPKVEMGDDTGTAKESWEGLGGEDKEGTGKENEDEDESEGKDGEEDLVSDSLLTLSFT